MDIQALLAPLQPLIDILSQKYLGIPLVLYVIGFTHLAIMAALVFGQTALELITKKLSS